MNSICSWGWPWTPEPPASTSSYTTTPSLWGAGDPTQGFVHDRQAPIDSILNSATLNPSLVSKRKVHLLNPFSWTLVTSFYCAWGCSEKEDLVFSKESVCAAQERNSGRLSIVILGISYLYHLTSLVDSSTYLLVVSGRFLAFPYLHPLQLILVSTSHCNCC